MAQLWFVLVSPRTVECRSVQGPFVILRTKQWWALWLFFDNARQVSSDRFSHQTCLQETPLMRENIFLEGNSVKIKIV